MLELIIFFYVITTVGGLVTLKLGTTGGSPVSIKNRRPVLILNRMVILGIVQYVVSFLLYAYLISKYDLGYIVPLTAAFVYIIIFIASYFIFKEAFTSTKVAAMLLIICGVILLGLHGV